jgi:hypothetical protein
MDIDSMSDICIKTQKEGKLSVTLSTSFYSLAVGDQIDQLENLVKLCRRKRSSWYGLSGDENTDGLETKLLKSLISAIDEGIGIKKITWEIEETMEDMVDDEIKEYWLRNSC